MLEIIRAYGQERLTEAADRGGGAGRAAPVARAVLHPAGRDERVLPARLPAAGVAAQHEGGRCRAGRGGTGSARPILRLIGPLGVLFRGFVTGQVALQPALFDDAVADPEPWVSATALVMRAHGRRRISWPRRVSSRRWGSGGAWRSRWLAWPCWKAGQTMRARP